MHVQAFTATGLKKDEVFVGDINTLYKSKNTVVDVKVDTYSNVRREVLVLNLNLWLFTHPAKINFLLLLWSFGHTVNAPLFALKYALIPC
jgi:hypothetical protein